MVEAAVSQQVFNEHHCSLQLAGGTVRLTGRDSGNLSLWQTHDMNSYSTLVNSRYTRGKTQGFEPGCAPSWWGKMMF